MAKSAQYRKKVVSLHHQTIKTRDYDNKTREIEATEVANQQVTGNANGRADVEGEPSAGEST